jgi:hypothetical protein
VLFISPLDKFSIWSFERISGIGDTALAIAANAALGRAVSGMLTFL